MGIRRKRCSAAAGILNCNCKFLYVYMDQHLSNSYAQQTAAKKMFGWLVH